MRYNRGSSDTRNPEIPRVVAGNCPVLATFALSNYLLLFRNELITLDFPTFGSPAISIHVPTVLNFGGLISCIVFIRWRMFSFVKAE